MLSDGNISDRYMQGGGVAFYIHSSINHKILYSSSNSHLSETEYLILEVSSHNCTNKFRTLLAVVYRRPSGIMLSEFFIMLENYLQSYKNIIIVGDFNIDVSSSSFESEHLKGLISERALEIIPSGPTHYGLGEPTTIDLAIVDSLSKVAKPPLPLDI